MKIWAISDLHLSGRSDKPMNVFGPEWEGHFEKIKRDWLDKVGEEDLVLLGGDTSWGMKYEDGMYDVLSLQPLPGKKVFIRGNHDFWWSGISRMRADAPEGFYFLQNDCVKFGEFVIAGSRGWTTPASSDFTEQDEKLYLREAERFKLAFHCAEKVRGEGDRLLVLMHYPPFSAFAAKRRGWSIF